MVKSLVGISNTTSIVNTTGIEKVNSTIKNVKHICTICMTEQIPYMTFTDVEFGHAHICRECAKRVESECKNRQSKIV